MIPIIDIGKPSDNEQCEKLVSVLSSIGFVYLRNHGISEEKIKSCRKVFSDFFSKNVDFKESFVVENEENPFLGYKGSESERLNPNRKEKDARESMLFWAHDIRTNRWPDGSIESAVISLVDRLGILADRVLNMIGTGLGLRDPDLLAKAHSAFGSGEGKSMTTFRVNHYRKLGEELLKEDQVLCGEHADYGSVTLLIQDHVGRLEVQNAAGEFVDAKPIEGTILLNIGLLLENWTNGKLRATRHRIVSPVKEDRMSMVLFATPDEDVMVEPLEELGGVNPKNYDGVLPNDFGKMMYAETL